LRITSTEAFVDYVTGPPAESRHSRTSVMLLDEDASRAEFPEWINGDAMKRVLDYHAHTNGLSHPSEADRNGWASALWHRDRSGWFDYPAIIVTPARDGSGAGLGVEFHGWWTYRQAPGEYVCVPAFVDHPMY
jgi:hypothetical protein